MKTLRTQRGFVYLMVSPDGTRAKVGFTTSPKDRFWSVANNLGMGTRLLLIAKGTRATESRVLRKFRHLAETGREWFRNDPMIFEYMKGKCNTVQLPIFGFCAHGYRVYNCNECKQMWHLY